MASNLESLIIQEIAVINEAINRIQKHIEVAYSDTSKLAIKAVMQDVRSKVSKFLEDGVLKYQ